MNYWSPIYHVILVQSFCNLGIKQELCVISRPYSTVVMRYSSMSIDSIEEISVLTFNVWGLYVSRDRVTRMKAISAALSQTSFDVVTLQELWVAGDFQLLKDKLSNSYPFAHHFHGGIVGAGLAVFSKHPIINIDFRPYRLNGKPIYINHGDWYAGKGIGHVKIKHPKRMIDLFTTHMVANYHDKKDGLDIYAVHRCMQMVEFCNLVSTHCNGDSLTLATGDFNIEDHNQLYNEIFEKGMFLRDRTFGLQSIWQAQITSDKATFNRHDNSYRNSVKDPECIDYILYDPSKATLKNTRLMFDELIEDIGISYSDHTAVSATFTFEGSNVHRTSGSSKLGHYYLEQGKAYMQILESRQLLLQTSLLASFLAFVGISVYGLRLNTYQPIRMVLGTSFLLLTVFLFQYSSLWLSFEINTLKQTTSEWACWLNSQ